MLDPNVTLVHAPSGERITDGRPSVTNAPMRSVRTTPAPLTGTSSHAIRLATPIAIAATTHARLMLVICVLLSAREIMCGRVQWNQAEIVCGRRKSVHARRAAYSFDRCARQAMRTKCDRYTAM